MRNFRRIGASLAIVGALLASSISVSAASSSTPGANGYKVAPVRTDITVSPGHSETVIVYVTNISNADENLQAVFNDFTARDESGTPALLLNNQNAPSHGLKQYMSTPNGTFSLKPGEQKGVNVQVSIPKNIAGGGYYGAVRFEPANTTGDRNVNLSASVTSLILVRVPGNVTDSMSVASLTVQKKPTDANQQAASGTFFTSGKDLQAVVRFQNEGNVQEEPFGKILLKKGSTTLDTQDVNTTVPPSNVLPGTIRKFTVDLHNIKGYGKYTIEGNFGYGSQGQLISAKTTFYVIPYALLVIGIIILILIIVAIVLLPRWLRRHDQGVLRRASRR